MTETFGCTTKGTLIQTSNNVMSFGGYNLPVTANPLSVHPYIKCHAPDLGKVKCAIYDATGVAQRPVNLYAYTEEKTITGSEDGFQTFNITNIIRTMTPQIYHLCIWTQLRVDLYRNSGCPSPNLETVKVQTYNGWPDPTTALAPDPYGLSIYCTYTPLVGGSEHYYYFKKKEEREEDEEEANQKDSPLDKIRFWEQSKKAFYGSSYYEMIKEVADKEIKAIIEKVNSREGS